MTNIQSPDILLCSYRLTPATRQSSSCQRKNQCSICRSQNWSWAAALLWNVSQAAQGNHQEGSPLHWATTGSGPALLCSALPNRLSLNQKEQTNDKCSWKSLSWNVIKFFHLKHLFLFPCLATAQTLKSSRLPTVPLRRRERISSEKSKSSLI